MDLRRIFGNNLKYYRFQKEYTQAHLAEKAGVSTNYLSELERGQHSADFSVISSLAIALEIEESQLFERRKTVNLPRRIDMNRK